MATHDQPEPEKHYLSTLPETCTLDELVATTHQRWHIERDYQELKQEFGLDHYEGRGWRRFHHHASLSITAYGFLLAERLTEGRLGSPLKKHSTPNARRTRRLRPARCCAGRSVTSRTRPPRCAISSACCSPPTCHESVLRQAKNQSIFMTQ